MSDPRGERDKKGYFQPGNSYGKGSIPGIWIEYRRWLEEKCLPKAQAVMLKCLDSDNEKIQMLAAKEVHDRIFGKARQQVEVSTGEGRAFGDEIRPILERLLEKK